MRVRHGKSYRIGIIIYQLATYYSVTQTRQIQVMHSPRLATVLMVEQTLQHSRQVLKVAELKRRLPRKVMHATLLQILDYLQQSGKILISTKGLVWIFKPPAELDKMKEGGLEL